MSIKCNINASIGTVTWTSSDESIKPLTIHLDRLHVNNQRYSSLHGLKQKIGDMAALGAGATDSDKFLAMMDGVEHLESGSPDWNAGRQSADSALIEALILSGKPDTAEFRAKIRALTPAERTALTTAESVKPHYDAIMARKTSGVNVSDLLSKL